MKRRKQPYLYNAEEVVRERDNLPQREFTLPDPTEQQEEEGVVQATPISGAAEKETGKKKKSAPRRNR